MKPLLIKKGIAPIFAFAIMGTVYARELPENSTLNMPERLDEKFGLHTTSRDTSSLFYYSFDYRKPIKYKDLLEESEFSLVTTCSGSSLVLSAPNYGKEASYEWVGPAGFKGKTVDIKLTGIDENKAGIYSVVVTKGQTTVYGKIKLVVNDTPLIKILETVFMEGEGIHLETRELIDAKYVWENADRKVLSKSKDLYLAAQNAGKYAYRLTIDKNGCKEVKDFVLEVNAYDKHSGYKSIMEALRLADKSKIN